jgi:chromosome segregation ATPase
MSSSSSIEKTRTSSGTPSIEKQLGTAYGDLRAHLGGLRQPTAKGTASALATHSALTSGEIAALKSEYGAMQEKYSQQKEETNAANGRIDELEALYGQAKSAVEGKAKLVRDLTNSITNLMGQLQSKGAELTETKEKLAAMTKSGEEKEVEITALLGKQTALEGELVTLGKQLTTQTETGEKLQSELNGEKEKVKELEIKLGRAILDRDNAVKRLTASHGNIKAMALGMARSIGLNMEEVRRSMEGASKTLGIGAYVQLMAFCTECTAELTKALEQISVTMKAEGEKLKALAKFEREDQPITKAYLPHIDPIDVHKEVDEEARRVLALLDS